MSGIPLRVEILGAGAELALVAGSMGSFAPPPDLPVSRWSVERRVLSRKDSARPGPWRPEPHQPELMDAMSDRAVRQVVLMGCSQFTGKSQCMNNVLGRYVDVEPTNIMAIFPSLSDAEKWSKGRLDPMCEATPALRDKLPPRKARDGNQTILHRQFPGGQLFVVGSNAPSGLSAQSVRIVMFDEVDRFEASAGQEGDPVELGTQRTVEYKSFAKVWMSSTPLIAGASRIEAAYLESDQRVWEVRCPHCADPADAEAGHFRIMWEHVRFQDPHTGEKRADLAHVECPLCGSCWTEADRLDAIDAGRWRATAPFAGIAGFHINAFGCKRADLAALADRFLRAQGNPEREKAFANLVEARTWRPRADAPPWERLLERREHWPANTLPRRALLLTAAADIQKDRIECRVWGWNAGAECWLIDRQVWTGNTARDEVWANLDAILDESWETEGGAEVKVERLAVDSGAFTQEVYRWAKTYRSNRRVMLVKGDHRQQLVLGTPQPTELSWDGKRTKYGVRVWPVGVSKAKEWLYQKLNLPAPDPDSGDAYPAGYVHLSADCDRNEIQQLTAEELRTGKDKYGRARPEWYLKPGHRNEALDCWVYAYAAAIEAGLWRQTEKGWARLAERMGVGEGVAGASPTAGGAQAATSDAAVARPQSAQERIASLFAPRVMGSGDPYVG